MKKVLLSLFYENTDANRLNDLPNARHTSTGYVSKVHIRSYPATEPHPCQSSHQLMEIWEKQEQL